MATSVQIPNRLMSFQEMGMLFSEHYGDNWISYAKNDINLIRELSEKSAGGPKYIIEPLTVKNLSVIIHANQSLIPNFKKSYVSELKDDEPATTKNSICPMLIAVSATAFAIISYLFGKSSRS